MTLSSVNFGDVQFLTGHGDFLFAIGSKGGAGLFVQSDCLTEFALCCQGDGFVATRAGNMEFNASAFLRVGLNGPVKEAQRLVILAEFIIDNGSIDIDLPGTPQFVMAYENFASSGSIT
jgi:hypothetical protein